MKSADALLIRADASPSMGTGHVMRCMALAEAWTRSAGAVLLAAAGLSEEMVGRLDQAEIPHVQLLAGEAQDPEILLQLVQKHAPIWVVLDGYHLGRVFQDPLKVAGYRVLVVDDFAHADHYSADLIVNPNLGAEVSMYTERAPGVQVLLGPRYAFLRREFTNLPRRERQHPDRARKILVTLGGADPGNVTSKALEALSLLEGEWEARVVLGAHFQQVAQIQNRFDSPRIQFLAATSRMPELMAWADVAVGAAGSTMWELAYMGLPSLLLVIAENQISAAEAMHSEGAARSLGWATEIRTQRLSEEIQAFCANLAQRQEMGARGTALVDGRGTERTLIRMLAHGVSLKPAESEDDLHNLWLWANDPLTRKMSFSCQEIGWEEHLAWHRHRKASGRGWLWIARDREGKPFGQVRFDEEADFVISIGLAPDSRGRGLGASLIAAGCLELLRRRGPTRIMAYIRPENGASIKAFTRAGFGKPVPSQWHNEPCLLMTCDAD